MSTSQPTLHHGIQADPKFFVHMSPRLVRFRSIHTPRAAHEPSCRLSTGCPNLVRDVVTSWVIKFLSGGPHAAARLSRSSTNRPSYVYDFIFLFIVNMSCMVQASPHVWPHQFLASYSLTACTEHSESMISIACRAMEPTCVMSTLPM
jgi:hypothetical protein